MARIVPSQIVDLIGQNPPGNSATLTVSHATVGILTAVARLIDELPAELLTISGADYSDLVCSVESIRNSVAFWQQKGVGEIGNPGIRGKNARS